MIRHRIADKTNLRQIDKWIKAGVMQEGEIQYPERGTHQGGPISCVLSNLYIHYVLDMWFEKVFKKSIEGKGYITRFVDDFVCCFEEKKDAERIDQELKTRMKQFKLEISEEKTRMIQFGRFARTDLSKRRLKPEKFTFLGFDHI